jgi:hypothetical protein
MRSARAASTSASMLPFALSEVVLERRERDLEPDVPAEAEAVGDGLGGRRELHLHAVDDARLDAMLQGVLPLARTTSSVGEVTFGMRACRSMSTHTRVRGLARHAVDLERAEQADDRVRDALAHLGERAQLGHGRVGEPVQAAVHLLEQAAIAEPLEVGPRDAGVIEVASAHRPLPGEPEERGGLGRGGSGHDT